MTTESLWVYPGWKKAVPNIFTSLKYEIAAFACLPIYIRKEEAILEKNRYVQLVLLFNKNGIFNARNASYLNWITTHRIYSYLEGAQLLLLDSLRLSYSLRTSPSPYFDS